MRKNNRKELFIFIALIFLGASLRLYGLDTYPAGLHGDEGITGLEARRILNEGYIGFWSPGALGQAALPFYWTALFFKIFGDSINTARLSFALLTVLWIPFFYLLTRLSFSKTTAIIATFLLVSGSTPLAFSRRADFVAMSFSFFPAIFFFLLSLKTNKRIYFVLAGIFIGLSHHMYASFWITPIALGIFTLYQMLILKKEFFKKYAKNFLLLLIPYFLIASPMIFFSIMNPNDMFSRSRMVSIFSPEGMSHTQRYFSDIPTLLDVIFHNTKVTFGIFNLTNDPDSWNNFSTNPIFDKLTGIFFLIGLIYCLNRLKDRQIFLCVFLFIIFLLVSILTVDAPNLRRSQASIYIAYIFAGVGFSWSYSLLKNKISFIKKYLSVFGIILVLYIGSYNTALYFFKYSISAEAKYILCFPLVKASEYIKTISNPYIYFYSNRWSYHYETMRFLLPYTPGEDRSTQFGPYSLINNKPQQNVVYLFLPEYEESFRSMQNLYPKGESEVKKDSDGSILFFAYFIPKS